MNERTLSTPADIIASIEAQRADPEIHEKAVKEAFARTYGLRALASSGDSTQISQLDLAYLNRTIQLLEDIAQRECYFLTDKEPEER